eukprot:14123131-Ditylum_brightwellii.AAC.1
MITINTVKHFQSISQDRAVQIHPQSGQTNDFYSENATPEELIRLMQGDAQDGTPVMQSTKPGPPLVVKQSNNKTNTEIQYKNPYT